VELQDKALEKKKEEEETAVQIRVSGKIVQRAAT